MIDVVVPAHNEAQTIGPVVRALQASPSVRQVIVVNDGSTDRTRQAALDAGAIVRTIDARDKGSAMAAGLEHVETGSVGFIDADLHGLTPLHVEQLAAHPGLMVVGQRDRSTPSLAGLPPIGGERVLPTEIARAADLAGSGYRAEMRLARAARRAGVATLRVPLRGVLHRTNRTPARLWRQVAGGYLDYVTRP